MFSKLFKKLGEFVIKKPKVKQAAPVQIPYFIRERLASPYTAEETTKTRK